MTPSEKNKLISDMISFNPKVTIAQFETAVKRREQLENNPQGRFYQENQTYKI